MKLSRAIAIILSLALIFTLGSCGKKEVIKEVSEEYEIIVEVGFVPFKFENVTPIKYEAIDGTTSKITAEYEGSTYEFWQSKDKERSLYDREKEEFETTTATVINGAYALLTYNEGGEAVCFWVESGFSKAIICRDGFSSENFYQMIMTSDEVQRETIDVEPKKVFFTSQSVEIPSGKVRIFDESADEPLLEGCPCFIITNPGADSVLTVKSDEVKGVPHASIDAVIFSGEYDQEANAFIVGEEIDHIEDIAELKDGSYVYDVPNPYPNETKKTAFAVGSDMIVDGTLLAGDFVVIILEP